MSEAVAYQYDVFISYSHFDRPWVKDELLPRLEQAGLKVCIDDHDFLYGRASQLNMEEAAKNSRHTIAVVTQNWVDSDWSQFEALTTTLKDPVGRARRLIPLLREDCALPERIQFLSYADFRVVDEQKWRLLLSQLTGEQTASTSNTTFSQVPAERLAGRQDVFAQIAAVWAKPGPCDSLVIFGHRRMGKSSIASNILTFCQLGDDTGLAFLNIQNVDWSQSLSDLCYAIAFQLWQAGPTTTQEPQHEDFQPYPLTTLRQFLATLDRQHPQRRYILILDEYELLDQKLSAAAANDFVTMLRGLTQQYPWLVMALVGLHALEERSASFYQAIYAWRPIRVGLMDKDAVADVLQVQDDNFPLEYDLDAITRVHALTGGQPFLVQLPGDSLVQRFNQKLRQRLEPPSPTFTVADVDAVVADPRFYQQGDVYFRGIWAQAREAPQGQHAILTVLAQHLEGLGRGSLQQASGLDDHAFNAALDALQRHDVVTSDNGPCRYTVELMRRWVEVGAINEQD